MQKAIRIERRGLHSAQKVSDNSKRGMPGAPPPPEKNNLRPKKSNCLTILRRGKNSVVYLKALMTVLLFAVSLASSLAGQPADCRTDEFPCGSGTFIDAQSDPSKVYGLPQSVSPASLDKHRDRRAKQRERLDCFDSACSPEYAAVQYCDLFCFRNAAAPHCESGCGIPMADSRNTGAGAPVKIRNLLL